MEEGRIRALAVTEPRRARTMPELPTIGEAVPGFGSVVSWIALFAPANTPKVVVLPEQGVSMDLPSRRYQGPEQRSRRLPKR